MKKYKFGLCPKCKKFTDLTIHHVIPKRITNGNGNGKLPVLFICRDCHDRLEIQIKKMERKLSRGKKKKPCSYGSYKKIAQDFL